MNNYCRNCGEKIENQASVCSKCNTQVLKERIDVERKTRQINISNRNEIFCVVFVVVCFVLIFISNSSLFQVLLFCFNILRNELISSLLFLVSIIVLICARVTMPNGKLIKMLTNNFIIMIILYLLFIFFIFPIDIIPF